MEVGREVNRTYPGSYHITLPYFVEDGIIESAVVELFRSTREAD